MLATGRSPVKLILGANSADCSWSREKAATRSPANSLSDVLLGLETMEVDGDEDLEVMEDSSIEDPDRMCLCAASSSPLTNSTQMNKYKLRA